MIVRSIFLIVSVMVMTLCNAGVTSHAPLFRHTYLSGSFNQCYVKQLRV